MAAEPGPARPAWRAGLTGTTTFCSYTTRWDATSYSSLESVTEQTKESYYLALRHTQSRTRSPQADWEPWISYFLEVLKEQKNGLQGKIEREQLILGELPELSAQTLELCRDRGRVSVADAAKLTGASRNTVKDRITSFVRKGFLIGHGAGRGTWYSNS